MRETGQYAPCASGDSKLEFDLRLDLRNSDEKVTAQLSGPHPYFENPGIASEKIGRVSCFAHGLQLF